MTGRTKILLDESEIPQQWYNIVPDLPSPPPPPLHPGTLQPVGPEGLAPLFPMALIAQEVSAEPTIDIPGGVLDVLSGGTAELKQAVMTYLEEHPRESAAHDGVRESA